MFFYCSWVFCCFLGGVGGGVVCFGCVGGLDLVDFEGVVVFDVVFYW